MTIDEALLYLERDDASIRFFSPQDYEAFVTLKKICEITTTALRGLYKQGIYRVGC